MLTLYELLELLPTSFKPNFSPRLNRLYYYLVEHRPTVRRNAAIDYLGREERLGYFNNLLNELKTEVTRYVITHASNTKDKHITIKETCYRDFAIYKILLSNGNRNAAIEIATTLLGKLKELELHSLAHIVANDLYHHYSSSREGDNSRLASKYRKQTQRLLHLTNVESIIRDYHSRVTSICNSKESFSNSEIAEVENAIQQTQEYLQLNNHQFNRLIYSMIVLWHGMLTDFERVVEICNLALNSIPGGYPNWRSHRFSFLHQKVSALAALGRLTEAKTIARESCKLVPIGSFNWHLALLKRIVVCLHAADYQEAYELYKAREKQKCESPELSEFWQIIWGYLYFLIQRGKIETHSEEKFQLGKFLNQMPIFSRDKAGYNINIILIQILVRLQRGQLGFLIDWVESLEQYIRSHTRHPATKRANIFITMIVKMEAAHFHRVGTEFRTQKLWKKLDDIPLKFGQSLAVEIVPYPILWKEILLMLDEKFQTRKGRRSIKA